MNRSHAKPAGDAPRISVVIPTYGRGPKLQRLLAGLARQTLPFAQFEVIVVDDGSPEPVVIDTHALPFACTLERQTNQGPGAARNTALRHVRAPLVLYLNDDALPAPDLLAVHLRAHARLQVPKAVLGSFPFNEASLRSPLTQVLSRTRLLFDFPVMKAGAEYGWANCYTCNLSLPTAEIRAIGGFDAAHFPEAIMDDTEFGWRLEKRGVRVLYRPDAVCHHDHELTPAAYLKRAIRLGVNQARFYRVHGDCALLGARAAGDLEANVIEPMRNTIAVFHAKAARVIELLERTEREQYGRAISDQQVIAIADLLTRIANVWSMRGQLLELTGVDPYTVLEGEIGAGETTSIVVLSKNALDTTRRCVAALRAGADARHPQQIVCVDNGSTDGSAEWLAEQPDVELVRNTENLGACRARNQALQQARGEWVVFMDNDAFVQPGWLAKLKRHAGMDPRIGVVGPLSDRAAHGQQIAVTSVLDDAKKGTVASSRDEMAIARTVDALLAQKRHGLSRAATLLSSFCVLVRRAVIERIGGFDERFTPWGFEDDDFTLRARLAGFHSRVAFDTFVRHEAYGGPKAAWHRELLLRNWQRFAQKWELDASKHGDYSRLQELLKNGVAPARLYCAYDGTQAFDRADLQPVGAGARAA